MKNQRNAAFTLIELLVVIAIIAILAAILFPVFAQAKLAAKKAAAISQTKQAATAMILYTADSDDQGPCGTVPDLSSVGVQRYKPNVFTMMSPAGWFVNPVIEDEHALIWHNTTEPYRKNFEMLNLPGTRAVGVTGWPAGVQRRAPQGSNLTFNGHLQYYSMTAIEAPSINPMLWQGFGNITRTGAASTNPRLNCAGTGPCMFNPGGPPQGDMAANARGDVFNILFTGETSYYVYGQTIIFVATDSSTRVIKPGNGNRAAGNARLNTVWPIQFLQPDGSVRPADNFIRGGFAGSSLHVGGFMPNNTYAN
ncbi:MAG: prepilin-type N-terminal cleavage/methylation domain-containing protein [Fimbriimonas sp.]|jgi:prepilin-type N-terminal cleavage/methylation domain-containing protein|nr:prepilin-type N-terminal cleavage/methylation domain-containing protein [Fimbriimonas sp.]